MLKGAFIFLVVISYGFSTYESYKNGPVRFPKTPGLPGVAGLYTVSEFRVNDRAIPYSKTDPTRWQDVVFETWNTVSIKSNRPVTIVNTDTEQLPANDREADYEFAGAQGRQYYRYTINPATQRLTLTNANPTNASEILQLTYIKAKNGQIILAGLNANRDSVYAVLDKVNKKYLVDEAAKAGRRGSLKL